MTSNMQLRARCRPSSGLLLISWGAAALFLLLPGCKNKSSESTGNDPKITKVEAVEDSGPPALPADAMALELPPAPPRVPAPLGLPKTPSPDYNPTTPEKVALGKLLFSELRLSKDESHACNLCHQQEHGWSNDKAVNETAAGALNLRHTPTLLNIGYHREFHWDGRSKPLEAHILGHWEGQLASDPGSVVSALLEVPLYAAHFARAFDTPPSADRAADAIAAYLRTVRSGNSPWDRYEAGESGAVSADVIAGAKIFNERAGCATCHTPPLYTDLGYHGIGVQDSAAEPDLGRGKDASEGPLFKTPSLRSLRLTAPYFHNGSAKTLEDVLTLKATMGSPALSADEQRKLMLFLGALTP